LVPSALTQTLDALFLFYLVAAYSSPNLQYTPVSSPNKSPTSACQPQQRSAPSIGRQSARINVETKCLSKPNTISNCQLTIFASTKRNAISSPLLRLPLELRNHIFSLALNHGYIPITYPERSRWKIKRAERRDFEYRYHYKRLCDFFYNPISFSSKSCSFKLRKRPIRNFKRLNHLKRPINLLFVCRQIYAETALLPYELNVFVVSGNDSAFQDFFAHRTLAQVGALARVRRAPNTRLGARPTTEWLERLKVCSARTWRSRD